MTSPHAPLLRLTSRICARRRLQRAAAVIRRLTCYDRALREDVIFRARRSNAHLLLTAVLGRHLSDATVVVRNPRRRCAWMRMWIRFCSSPG